MALTVVQTTPKVEAASGTLAITIATPPTAGQAIVVVVLGYNGNAIPTRCTDTYGNPYLRTAGFAAGGFGAGVAHWLCPRVLTTGAGSTITLTIHTPSVATAIVVSGVGDGLAVDREAHASGNSGTPASGALAAITAAEVLLVGAQSNQSSQASITVQSVTPPWVEAIESLTTTATAGEVDYRVVPAATGTTPTVSWTMPSAAFWSALLVAYRAITVTPGLTRVGVAATLNNTAANSHTLTFSTAPAVGNGLILPLTFFTSGANLIPSTVVDNQGHTFLLAATGVSASSTVSRVAIFVLPKITAVAGTYTVTVTYAGTQAGYTSGAAIEVSGVGVGLTVATATSLGSTGSGTAPSTGTAPASPVAEVLVVAVCNSSTGLTTITVQSVSPPWTQEFEYLPGSHATGEGDSRLLTGQSGLTQTCAWTYNAASHWAAALAAFTGTSLPVVLVTVPDVVGLTAAAADTALAGAGLIPGTVTTATDATVAAGLVISQSPSAGSSVATGSAVDYVISLGPPGPPVYVVGIGETEVVPLLATFRIQETIDAPDTMIADVFSLAAPPPLPAYQARILADGATAYWPLDDPSGTTARDLVGADDPVPFVRFALGQPVVVTENGVRIFGGVVTGTRERGLTGPSATDLVVEIQATSYELSAARRVITAAISQDGAETIGAAFATLVTDYYAEVGVSLHPSQVAGPALPAATFTRSRGDAVNKHLAASVGYLQSIDFENRLRAWAPGDILAPESYDEAVNPELLTGDITVERQLQNGYANRVILTGDPIPVPGHVDHFTGDGVTNVWPVTYVVNGPYPYFVDGAVAQGVIQYPATSTTESIGGVESPPGFLWEYDPIAHTIHRRGGPVAAGVAFDFPYDGLFIPAGTAEDAGEIAALGLWEHVENVTAVITDVSAQGYADALLATKIASKDEIVRLQTRALGFHPGQTITIASFSRLLAGDYLITQVDTGSESGGILLVRSITASKSQNNTHDWRRVYQQWAGASAAQNP